MGVHMASFCLLSVVNALYSKTNESTADTRGQSQVHCTRQGSTADAKEPLWHCISERNPLQRNFRSHMAEAHARKNAAEILVSVGTVMKRLVATVSNTSAMSPSIFAEKSARSAAVVRA